MRLGSKKSGINQPLPYEIVVLEYRAEWWNDAHQRIRRPLVERSEETGKQGRQDQDFRTAGTEILNVDRRIDPGVAVYF